MLTAGIDVGLEYTKVILLRDGEIAAARAGLSGGLARREAVGQLWEEALAEAGISAADIDKIIATGQGKFDVDFADELVVEPVADAKAARFLCPEAAFVVDLGGDQVRKVALGAGDKILEVTQNQKCGGGIGIALQLIARRLGMTIEEVAALSPGAADGAVNDGCPVFAELDALELLNDGVAPAQIAAAVVAALAVRVNAVLNDKLVPAGKTLLIGGLARNSAFVSALKDRSNIDFLIPDHAEYGGALGAALLAAG